MVIMFISHYLYLEIIETRKMDLHKLLLFVNYFLFLGIFV